MYFNRVFILTLFFALGAINVVNNIPISQAATQTASGNITVAAAVPGLPPSTPPTIDSPSNNENFDTKNITVSGICIPFLIVKVFSNNIFTGSTICSGSGTYSINIDLFEARNDLIARQYDSLNQPSPNSNTVTVYFVPPNQPSIPAQPDQPISQAVGFQLRINYDYTVQGIFPGKVFHLPISFFGGFPPYAVSIDWGDGSSSVFSRNSDASFDAEHVYSKPGYYIVKIRVSDSQGNEGYLQFVLVVNGQFDSPVDRIIDWVYPVSPWTLILLIAICVSSIGMGIIVERKYLSKRHSKKHL